MRLRLADMLAITASRDTTSRCACLSPGCVGTTREGKDFCIEHMDLIPYVADLEARIAKRAEDDAAVTKRGPKAVDVGSITTIELLRYLDLYGPRTQERCIRELALEPQTLKSYVDALCRRGFVTTGFTKRGSTVVRLMPAGQAHLRGEYDPQSLAKPPKPRVKRKYTRRPKIMPNPPAPVSASPQTQELEPPPAEPPPPVIESPSVTAASAPNSASGASSSVEEAGYVSVDDAKLATEQTARPSAAKSKGAFMGLDTIKAQLVKLRSAHSAYEGTIREYAKALADGDNDEAVLVLIDLATVEKEIAAVKSNVFNSLVSIGRGATKKSKKTESSAAPKKTVAQKKPKAKAPTAKKIAKPAVSAPKPAVSSTAFAGWLRTVRTGVGLTQSAFGEKIGASYTQMYVWEKGIRAPSDDYITKIEKLVGKAYPYKPKPTPAAVSVG